MRKLIIFINLLALIVSYGEYYTFNATYQKEFVVPKDNYPDYSYSFNFRLALPKNNEKLQVTIKYSDRYDSYSISSCYFENYPTDEEIFRCYGNSLYDSSKIKDKEYTKFIYPLSKFSNEIKYLVIKVDMREKFEYFSILVSPYKERKSMIMETIEYNKEFIMDGEDLSNTDKRFYFSVKEYKKGELEYFSLKIHKNDESDFLIQLVGLESLDDMYNQNKYIELRGYMNPKYIEEDGDYKIYKYRFTRLDSDTKSLFILVNSIDNCELKYFSFKLSTTNS